MLIISAIQELSLDCFGKSLGLYCMLAVAYKTLIDI